MPSSEGQEAVPGGERAQTDERKRLRALERDPYNRLRSIVADAQLVESVAAHFADLPVVPNLRCGAWYVDPSRHAAKGCYFKSTDGHTHNWGFSLKRPNLHLAELCLERGGALVVDSTRRGKSMPDALSKTVPIWCAVLNEASRQRYGEPAPASPPPPCQHRSPGTLRVPSHIVSPSEEAQIAERIAGWVGDLLSSALPVPRLRAPLVPFFCSPQFADPALSCSAGSLCALAAGRCLRVVLLSASWPVSIAPVTDGGSSSRGPSCWEQAPHTANAFDDNPFTYVQGSGDDEEAWATGLSPALLWAHRDEILRSRADCQDAIGTIVQAERLRVRSHTLLQQVQPAPIWLQLPAEPVADGPWSLVVHCQGAPATDETREDARTLSLDLPAGKKGARLLRTVLPGAIATITRSLLRRAATDRKVLITSTSDASLPGSIALALLAASFTSDGRFVPDIAPDSMDHAARLEAHRKALTKADARRCLQWLVSSAPDFTPSRGHLLRVHDAVLPTPDGVRGSAGAQLELSTQ
ncbi:initiator tRNA phosphoribosyl transferase [Tilletiopsis washingtonensis]|uniref:Initiator tRNA phosphoribosyl transferase n=1 Tax=Tilletiopsis washingtonensis TaxID=58919 RepID=A0A316Z935_9BASI|nr:initiator tRNA phosphoribosyl transferase [Tilletiopsis washingtonensis]PWN97776.1 initiator tRNA phosphoribosyl transferase [Tilletiopsis washingtonensis]